MLRNLQSALKQAKEEVGEKSKQRGGDRTREDECVADESDTTKDEGAKTAGADGGGDRRDPDGDDGGGSNAGEDDSERKREAHAKKNLCARHAHGFRSFEDGGIDSGKADVRVAQDGEKRVEDESDDGGAFADAADEWDGNQKAEEGETRDSLKNAGDAQRDSSKRAALHDEHAKRNADENGDHHGNDYEREVVDGGPENFGAVLGKEGPSGLWIHGRAPGVTAREAVKARTSG